MTRIAAILLILGAWPAYGQTEKALRYVSQRTDNAYLREGPSYAHKVLWVYRHRGYPYAVLAQFDVWRRVEAADGTVGWMSAAMLSDQRTILVTGKGRAQVFERPDGGSGGIGRSWRYCRLKGMQSRYLPHPRPRSGWLDPQKPDLGGWRN
jgi:hypothetical protein